MSVFVRSEAAGVAPFERPAINSARLMMDVANRALSSVAVEQVGANTPAGSDIAKPFANFTQAAPIPVAIRLAALKQVDQDLVKEGLLDKLGGTIPAAIQKTLGWERTMSIPTPGVLVKGCLDHCDICWRNHRNTAAARRPKPRRPRTSCHVAESVRAARASGQRWAMTKPRSVDATGEALSRFVWIRPCRSVANPARLAAWKSSSLKPWV